MERPAILVLGGTAEANASIDALCEALPEARLILSLAGRTTAPVMPGNCVVRIGGFGGVDGLASYLEAEAIAVLLDATHPFAAGMSRNAVSAAERAGIRRIALLRPEWRPVEGDRWTKVACLAEARDALPAGSRPFLALGRQHLAPFRHRSDISPVVRMIEPPQPPLPFPADLILARPLADPAEEAALLRRFAVSHLVCRNAGGPASYAKIAAARMLGLEVVLIDRPEAPPPPITTTVGETVEAVLAALAGARAGSPAEACPSGIGARPRAGHAGKAT